LVRHFCSVPLIRLTCVGSGLRPAILATHPVIGTINREINSEQIGAQS
jgi:hypothetical protein